MDSLRSLGTGGGLGTGTIQRRKGRVGKMWSGGHGRVDRKRMGRILENSGWANRTRLERQWLLESCHGCRGS